MSKHASSLIVKNNINGGKFLANGVIETSTESLNKAKSASQTVCTFIGKVDADFKEGVEATLKILTTQKAEKHELESLDSEFTGKATLIATEVSQEEIKNESISLLCLNLDSEKLSVDKITAALGSEITSAPIKVATEVTDSSSETVQVEAAPAKASSGTALTTGLAAAQPAGSPQDQFLASATTTLQAEKAAQDEADAKAKEAQELAAQKAKEAKEAAQQQQQQASATTTVVSTPAASGGASTTAAAKADAGDGVEVVNLDALKDMVNRYEAEAKEAEANVAKLESEKASAEAIQEAKGVAQLRRQSADEAKAKYEAAVKNAALAETKTT